MADSQNISNILAALASQQNAGGTPIQGPPPGAPPAYPPSYTTQTPPVGGVPYNLPPPINSGTLDVGAIKPVKSGSVSIADAIAKARGIAAEKGVSYDPNRGMYTEEKWRQGRRTYGNQVPSRNTSQSYRRSRSPSPARPIRDTFRDNYNPYRDERRGAPDKGYGRERSYSPPPRGRYSPVYGVTDDRSPGRGKGEGDSETIPIEKSLVGLIIGRAGENLRRVESTTGARVQFMDGPDSSGSVRHCKISGSRASRASAKSEIFRIMEENGDKNRGRNQKYSQPPPDDDQSGVQVMVPDRTVGLIIGRGGETIRDLQERSGCHVNIVSENKSVNGLRPVNLIGTQQAQQRAKDFIMEIVESDTNSGSNRAQPNMRGGGRDSQAGGSQDKINDSLTVPGDAVGMIIGKGGESIKEMQNNTGCKINVSPPSGRDIEREIGLIGSRYAIDAAKRAIMEKVEVVESRNRGESDSRREPAYDNTYSQGQQQQGSYGQPPSEQAAQAPPGGEDPYAAYGGYQNYLAMWYAALQQQQGGQASGEQPGPPGTG